MFSYPEIKMGDVCDILISSGVKVFDDRIDISVKIIYTAEESHSLKSIWFSNTLEAKEMTNKIYKQMLYQVASFITK